jgi:hypothetical protein
MENRRRDTPLGRGARHSRSAHRRRRHERRDTTARHAHDTRLWDGLEALEAGYAIEAVSTPSGVTHLTFTR